MSSNQINGGQYIQFGKSKVEIGKSDGVKKETLSQNTPMNEKVFNSIFAKFDINNDGKLDSAELNNIYQQYINAAKDGKMSKQEAKAFAQQLGLENVGEVELSQFLEAISSENDQFSAQWEDNVYTERDGNTTTVREYADNEHTQIKRETVKSGNETTITENTENGRIVTTTLGNGDMIINQKREEFDAQGRKIREESTNANGEKTVTEYAEDGSYTVKDGTSEKQYDKDGKLVDEFIDYTKVSPKNQGMILYLALSNSDTIVDKKYMNTLAKFPDVSLTELTELLKAYPSTAEMVVDYFSSSDSSQTRTNFEQFLKKLGIDPKEMGYSIGYITRTANGTTQYSPTLYYEGKPIAKSEMPAKMIELVSA